ncbi:unnamed protein product, partial [Cyprideis torosa]
MQPRTKKPIRCDFQGGVVFFVVLAVLWALTDSAAYASTRDQVKERGHLLCGVSTGMPGFSSVDGKGNWSGLDVDICRAVAAAVLGDKNKVEFVPLLPTERVTALLGEDVDILARNYTWSLRRDTSLNLNVVALTFLDFQGFLVAKSKDVKSLQDMDDFSVCFLYDSTSAEQLQDFFTGKKKTYKEVVAQTPDQIIADFESGRCEVVTGGRAQLQGIRSKLKDPGETEFLSEVLGAVPLGPAVREGDDLWFDIVKWSFFAMVKAEELG